MAIFNEQNLTDHQIPLYYETENNCVTLDVSNQIVQEGGTYLKDDSEIVFVPDNLILLRNRILNTLCCCTITLSVPYNYLFRQLCLFCCFVNTDNNVDCWCYENRNIDGKNKFKIDDYDCCCLLCGSYNACDFMCYANHYDDRLYPIAICLSVPYLIFVRWPMLSLTYILFLISMPFFILLCLCYVLCILIKSYWHLFNIPNQIHNINLV